MELHAELAWLAHERSDHELARKHLAYLIPDKTSAAVEDIRQPSICWCCFQVLKVEDSDTARALLKNGYTTLQEVLAQISDPKAREHYLDKLPHHAALMKSWEESDKPD